MTTITAISPVYIIPADPNVNAAIKLRYESIRRAAPKLPQDYALQIACWQIGDLMAHPHCVGTESELRDWDERKAEYES